MPEFYSGAVTFLFTDVEGSTRLLKQLRQRYGELLGQHREILREAFQQFAGEEIDSQGDAFFVCFRRAKHAVEAAAAAQRALQAYDWPQGAEFRVRMGIHTGEAEVEDGRYHGVAVHRGARIMAAAHGGQVLLSQTTRDLLEDEEEEAAGIALRDLGEQSLKDLDRPVHLYQLVIEGLQSEFPPLRLEAELGAGAEAAIAAPPLYKKRSVWAGAVAGVIAAAVAIPLFALTANNPEASATVTPNSVAVIDPATDKVVKDVPVGVQPAAITSGMGSVWVATLQDEAVDRIDPIARERVHTIPVKGGSPSGIAAGSGSLWVAYGNNGRVDRIDPKYDTLLKATNVHVEELPGFANGPGARELTLAGKTVWLANLDATVVPFDAGNGKQGAAIRAGGGHFPAIAVGAGKVWESADNENQIWELDPATGARVGLISAGGEISAMIVRGETLWAADRGDNEVLGFDTETLHQTHIVHVGRNPSGLAFAGGSIWVTNAGDGTVSQVDPSSGASKTIRLGARPVGVTAAAGRIWVTVQPDPTPRNWRSDHTVRVAWVGHFSYGATDPVAGGTPIACANLLNYPDRAGAAGRHLVPELATALPAISDGGKTYLFTLRSGIQFSNGDPVSPQAFKDTIERTLDPAMHSDNHFLDDIAGAQQFEAGHTSHIAGISAQGRRLTIHLTHAVPDFPARLSMGQFCVLPAGFPHTLGGGFGPTRGVIPSAGPYYTASTIPDGSIILKRNPRYRGGRPHSFEEIDWISTLGHPSLGKQVESGELDWDPYMFGIPREQVKGLLDSFGPGSKAATAGRQRILEGPLTGTFGLALNTSRAAFHDVRLRQAINYAIDREAISRLINSSFIVATRPTDQYLDATIPGYRDAKIYPSTPNLVRARGLARAAGYRGKVVVYACQESQTETNPIPCPQVTSLVVDALRKIGLQPVVKTFAFSVVIANMSTPGKPWDIGFPANWSTPYPDPGFLNAVLAGDQIHPVGNLNLAYFDDPAYTRKLQAAAQLSGDARLRAYGNLDVEIARRAAPYVPLFNIVIRDFFSARIGCQVYQPVYQGFDAATFCVR